MLSIHASAPCVSWKPAVARIRECCLLPAPTSPARRGSFLGRGLLRLACWPASSAAGAQIRRVCVIQSRHGGRSFAFTATLARASTAEFAVRSRARRRANFVLVQKALFQPLGRAPLACRRRVSTAMACRSASRHPPTVLAAALPNSRDGHAARHALISSCVLRWSPFRC